MSNYSWILRIKWALTMSAMSYPSLKLKPNMFIPLNSSYVSLYFSLPSLSLTHIYIYILRVTISIFIPDCVYEGKKQRIYAWFDKFTLYANLCATLNAYKGMQLSARSTSFKKVSIQMLPSKQASFPWRIEPLHFNPKPHMHQITINLGFQGGNTMILSPITLD